MECVCEHKKDENECLRINMCVCLSVNECV